MTTIATKNGTMAADSQVTSEAGYRIANVNKIYKNKAGFLLGMAGDPTHMREVREWFYQGVDSDLPENAQNQEGIQVLVVSPDKEIFMHFGGPRLIKVDEEFAAIGSGDIPARVAMDLGLSAGAAVEVAARYDVCSGGKIHLLEAGE